MRKLDLVRSSQVSARSGQVRSGYDKQRRGKVRSRSG